MQMMIQTLDFLQLFSWTCQELDTELAPNFEMYQNCFCLRQAFLYNKTYLQKHEHSDKTMVEV